MPGTPDQDVEIWVDGAPVSATNPIPTSAAAGGGSQAVTIADGADATQGAVADAAVDTDANGTISGKLRGIVKRLVQLLTAPTNATSSALEASRVVKATAGTLYGVSGFNNKSSAQYIQIHDAAALPADTAAPVVVFEVAATSPFAADFGFWGRAFANGIAMSNSSTLATKTIGSADCWFDAQYK